MEFQKYPFERLNELLEGIEANSSYEPIALTIGEPQFATPQFIKDALSNSIDTLNKYPKTSGELELKEAQLSYLEQRFDLDLALEQIIPTFGTRELLFNFPQFFLADKKSPKVAYVNPFYQIYEGAAIASSAEVVYLNLEKENGFKPQIDREVLKDVDLVILNTPSNPTASVMSLEEMTEWVKLALEYDFVLLNDECYIELYSKEPIPSILNASIAAGNSEFKNILTANSVSKRSSAPGLRSGFVAGDSAILKEYLKYRTYVGCASPVPLQYAAAAAWREQEHVQEFRELYRENLELAGEILGVDVPDATFYIWLEVDDALAKAQKLYEEYNVKVLPGEFLGRDGAGKGYWRLALVYEPEITKEALLRIRKFLKG
ncbi:MAG TPA: succinyldiaminopimelate transaminase [Nitratifractor sp.]|nr:succinyldiaminopimelate transaminase [Nitratifractor sp.]HHD74752.1 succinyldiaminopimelate transaminase [Nitratifractor sp.]